MTIWITALDPPYTVFAFDCEQVEKRGTNIKWTDRAIEAFGDLPDYGVLEPVKYEVEGIVTATPLDGTQPSAQRPGNEVFRLQRIASKKQIVTLDTGTYIAQLGIASVEEERNSDLGDAIRVSVKLVQLKSSQSATVSMAPMKPKYGRTSKPSTKGGQSSAAVGRPAKRQESVLIKIGKSAGLVK